MNYIKLNGMIFPEQSIAKFYVRNTNGIDELMVQDFYGDSYQLTNGLHCNVKEYLKSQLELLGWTDKSVPDVPFMQTEEKTIKNMEEFTATVNIPTGFSEPEHKSSNELVAIVNPTTGEVSATGVGNCVIDIHFKKPFDTLVKRIYLRVIPEQPLINKTTKSAHIGEIVKVVPKYIYGFSNTEWTSDDTDVASIDNAGNLILNKTGACTLRGYYSYPYRAQVEEISLTVNPAPPELDNEWINVIVGTSHQGLMPENSIYSGTKWEVVSGKDIVDVNVNGAITGNKIGKAVVVGKFTKPYEIEAVRYQINVIQPPEGEAVILSISSVPTSVKVGSNAVIAVQFSKDPIATPTLETDEHAYVEDALHSEGPVGHAVITGKKPGFATITVRVGTSSLIKKISIIE